MIQGTGKGAPLSVAAAEASQSGNNQAVRGGGGSGGYLSNEKDAAQASTAPKFGEIYNQIQAKFGAKPEKPREIKKTLGKDDFLKIMLTQMKNQDPTNPFKAEQMATEVAQFTSVEQLSNVNQNLTKMAAQNKPLEQMSMTNMIGKIVTIDRQRFPHLEGQNDSLSFNLPRDAETVQIAIVSEAGEEILTKDLGPQKAGSVDFTWDGLKSNTLPAKAGNYMLRVNAKNDKGQNVETDPQVQARVIGLSFEGTEAVFLVGDSKHQDRVTMKNIIRVDIDPNQPVNFMNGAPGNSGNIGIPSQPAAPKPKSFITFQKGVGSSTFVPGQADQSMPSGISPEVARALENYQQAQDQQVQDKVDARFDEKGFPNGLHDSDEVKSDLSKTDLNKNDLNNIQSKKGCNQ